MPGFVQHYTETGYGYMDPWVGQVRNAVPLIDASVRRIEPYIPPVIRTTDDCIDSACATAQKQAELLREKKAEVEVRAMELSEAATSRVRKAAGESAILGSLQNASVAVVEKSEQMVDRLLPPVATETAPPVEHGTLMRALQIPKHAVERTTRLVMLKISVLVSFFSTYVESTRTFVKEQKSKLLDWTTSRYGSVSSYVSETLEPSRLALQKRRAVVVDKAEAVSRRCNDHLAAVANRLADARSSAAMKVQSVKQTVSTLAVTLVSRAYKATSNVVGEDRAAAVFRRIHADAVLEKSKQT